MTQTFCPLPKQAHDVVTMAHGSGGKQTSELLETIFRPAFQNAILDTLHDGAHLTIPEERLVFTTDSYVIDPLFFPGGNIGKLAVCGTLNDVAMCGAQPKYLSCSMIIEEGFSKEDLKRIVLSMQEEAHKHGVQIVTGDTKVIDRSRGGNLYINTAGIGVSLTSTPITPQTIQEGDAIIVSGDLGRHGMTIMATREGFNFSTPLESDCATLYPLVHALLKANINIHCMRDVTRGGLATTLVELSEASQTTFDTIESAIPVSDEVSNLCSILGFDPLFVACEGRMVLFVPEIHAQRALEILHRFDESKQAAAIGTVKQADGIGVTLKNGYGVKRILHKLSGNQLPRIC